MGPVRPIARLRPVRFTRDSGLRRMVVRMITTNSLAAFTAEVTRNANLAPVRAPAASGEAPRAAAPAQRPLEAVPPPPASPLPRGSLLDLRV